MTPSAIHEIAPAVTLGGTQPVECSQIMQLASGHQVSRVPFMAGLFVTKTRNAASFSKMMAHRPSEGAPQEIPITCQGGCHLRFEAPRTCRSVFGTSWVCGSTYTAGAVPPKIPETASNDS